MATFAISFAFGIWLLQQQAVLPDFAWAWLLAASPLVLFVPRRNVTARMIHALLIAAFAGGIGFYYSAWQAGQRLAISLPDEWQGRDIVVSGVIADLPRAHERGLSFTFDVERTLTPQAVVPPHILLSTYQDDKTPPLILHAGERWHFTVRLKQPHGTANPSGFDFEAWALERGIRAVGYVHNSKKLVAGHPKGDNVRLDELAEGFGYRLETWREAVRDKFAATLGSAPYSGVLTALAVGDQHSIPPDQWQVFTRTGVNHLMSISGLHITMLASLAFAVVCWLWRRSMRLTLWLPARKVAALAALLTAFSYALLSGFAVPAQRTVYMVGAVAAALWLNRNFSLGQLLSIALIGVLIPDPWAVLSAGFWLSFGAVALILLVTAHRVRPPHWLSQYATVQWAMTVGLTPLLLALFQQVSLVSPLANALAIPLVSLIVVPLTLLGAALPIEMPLWLAHIAMDGTMHFLEWLNALPQAVWTQHAPPAWTIAAAMLGVFWLLLPRGFPARWLGAPLMLPMFLNAPEPPPPGMLRLIVFDVGQGLAVAAQTNDHALLYDTGPDFSGEADSGNRILVPALRAAGIAKLDGLMLSHDDLDHTGGTASVMQAIPIGWISAPMNPNHALLQQTTDARPCQDGLRWDWDGVRFEVLHPEPGGTGSKPHDNDQSCVLRISAGRQHILLAGDIEKETEQRLLRLHADQLATSLLVVPHHGSKSSSGHDFIAATLPDYAVFTVGYRNRFGHPRKEVLQRYTDTGAQLLRSDEDGAILVEMDTRGIKVERYRKTHARYWQHHPGEGV
ncbi:DNA internalization-related competence protein ComEC/Rec2 [Ferrigenium kumadai]|uniref:DNA internalization-related competence protein ComEC/Rec2 n=1 Tax=Ferrigenium kumadai TaxID=1682490 RepID=A0AAN1SZV9_9PROT|nr:DNA internalization-related competence protein ComEC/Rec2 [Ferrigenium kumadai]BBI99862.1 DNA internalization-related competence protein ComEC/Rec2 [Ferrigenium kumadai]